MFSLLEVEWTLRLFEGVMGDRAVQEGKIALLFATRSRVVKPLIGFRGTNTDVLVTNLLDNASGAFRAANH